MSRIAWSINGQGWCCTTVKVGLRPVFIALMREGPRSWRWLGFANGHPLGAFNGIVNAKRQAPGRAQEVMATP